jgi:DNA-directed RNA polymerase subunit beta
MDAEEILSDLLHPSIYTRDGEGWRIPFQPETAEGQKATTDMIDADSGEVVVEAGKKLTPRQPSS